MKMKYGNTLKKELLKKKKIIYLRNQRKENILELEPKTKLAFRLLVVYLIKAVRLFSGQKHFGSPRSHHMS